MFVCAHTKHVPCPRSHLAASALWRVSFHSSSDTWSLLGTRLRRKWNCGHQSARSSQNIFNSLVSWAAQNWVRAAASFFQAVTQNWHAAWSSLTKSAPKISTSPFDWSVKKQSTKKKQFKWTVFWQCTSIIKGKNIPRVTFGISTVRAYHPKFNNS